MSDRPEAKLEQVAMLREWAHEKHDMIMGHGLSELLEFTPCDRKSLLNIADAIEAEIETRWMRLPLDADGVPIHIYDRLLKSTGAQKPTYGEVVGISDDSVFFSEKQGWSSNWASLTRHAKPDKLKELLEELAAKAENDVNWRFNSDEAITGLCQRIREMAGKGEL